MDLHLKDKVVVITGGGTGIGKAAAMEFLREGARVIILGRRTEVLEEAAREAAGEGLALEYESCDVTDRALTEETADRIMEKHSRLDVWVNNAGMAIDKPFLSFTDEDFEKITSINQKAVFTGTQIAAQRMKKQKSGVILNASSYCAKIPHANGVLYAATKAAVSNMTRATAAALAPYGIRVVGYIPGMIVTPISESMIGQYREKFIKDISLGRLGRPEDLAKPLVFLASDAAAYITGIDLEISGGKFAVQDCAMGWRLAEEQT